MKNLPLLFLLCLLSFGLKAQVMHSSNAMEYSFGEERFSQFIAQITGTQSGGSLGTRVKPPEYRWQPMLSGRYKKFQDSGNYFGFGLHVGYSTWREEVLLDEFIDFGGNPIFLSSERNRETKFGISYQYSFLINKEKDSNFQFFIGGAADVYSSFSSKTETSFFFFPLRRNIIGARISAVPELMYLFPNSRMTLSLRGIIPIADLHRVEEDLRQTSLSSFIQFATVTSNFQFVPIGLSRFELGFGYFLKAE